MMGRAATRWGEQPDVRNITTRDDQAGELSAEQVATSPSTPLR